MFGKPTASLFGAPGNTSFGSNTFGTPNNATFGGGATFGSSPFGSSNQPTSTGLFGSTNPTAGSLFGSANTSAFGTSTGNNTFNFGGGTGLQTSQQGANLFGSSATSGYGTGTTSLFGQGAQQSTGFGQPAGGGMNLFGGATASNAPSFLGGLGTQQSGTTIKFVPVSGSDAMMKAGTSINISTKMFCITGMKEYENKSFEELRFEDYQANRKSAPTLGGSFLSTSQQQSQASGFGMFGNQNKSAFSGFTTSTAASTSLFGSNLSQSKPMFGGATTTTTASSGFGGLSSGSPFGGNKPGGLFGATATTTQSSFGLFGTQPQASTAFGLGSQSTNAGGIFGAKPLSFGQTGTSSTFTFGTAQTAQSGLGGAFGAGTFNKTAASGATGFGLGTQNTSLGFGGFGSTPLGSTSGFGAIGSSNTTGSLFSNQQKPAGSIFGNTATSGFGLGGGLGNTTLTTGGLGSANTGTLGTGMFGASTCFGGQPQQLQQQQQQNTELLMLLEQQKQIQHHIAALNASPYGDNPLFKNLLADPSRQNELLKPTNPMAQQTLLSTQLRYKHSQDRPAIKTVPLTDRSEKSLLFDCLDDDAPGSANQNQNLEETFVPRKNYKYLDVKSILQQQQTYNNMKEAIDQSRTGSPQPSANVLDGNRRSPIVIGPSNSDFGQLGRSSVRTKSRHDLEDSRYDGNPLNNTMDELIPKNVRPSNAAERDDHHNSVPTNGMMAVHVSPKTPHLAGVVLTRPDYFTLPSLEEMEGSMNKDGRCVVRDLVIGREGYGNVLFPGETDVTNLNLDELVHFRRKEIEIYPDNTKKHPRGEGLNKKAQVTLDMVYPIDKTTKQPITDYNRLMSMGFVEKLERKCIGMQAKFVEYRPETGSYVFIVDHFSKYGMLDDSDDDEELVEGAKKSEVDQLGKKPLQQQAQPVGTPKKTAKEQPKQLFATPIQPARHAHFMKNDDEDDENMTCDDEDDKFQRLTKRVKVTPFPKMGFTVGDDTVEDDDEIGEGKENSFLSSGKGVAYYEDDYDGNDAENDATCFGSQLKSPTYETLGQVSAHQVQLQKASFFGGLMDDDEEEELEAIKRKARVVRESMFKDLSFSSNKQSVISSPFASNASMMTHTDIISRQSPSLPPHSFSVRAGLMSQNLPPASTATISVLSKVAVAFKSSHPIVPSRLTEEDLKALNGRLSTVVMARKQVCVPLEKSLMFRKQNLTHDLGLFQGASTRTGWGSYMGEDCPGWPLVHVGHAICGVSEAEGKTNNFGLMARQNAMKLLDTGDLSFVVKVERILPPASFGDGNGMKDVLEVCLQAELDHCQVECSLMEVGGDENAPLEPSSACPYISYSKEPQSLLREVTNELLKLADRSEWSMNMSSVWKLCLSLWGDLGAVDGSNLDDYYVQSLRKEAVTGWLVEDAAKRIAEEIKLLGGDNSDGSVTFSYLTGFQVKQAVEAAMKVKDFHMSLILSQASCPDDVRLMLRKQLELWSDSKSDQFISESRMAVFALLGGVLMLRTSKGEINCCKSLDWKRCFGLHLWYACPSTCTISEALGEYEHAYQGSTPHCAAPNPPYMERWGLDEEAGVVDVTFHLLKLFCNKSYPLHKILNPASFSENDLDYSCSWHLLKLLGSLGYQHISDFHLASVCHNYASQLEAIGQWHWAAFVLMHIKHPISRSDAIKKLVTRNVELLQRDKDVDDDGVCNDDITDDEDMTLLNDKEKFLVEKLRIPVEWIHEAKAIKANTEGQEKLRSIHLFKAQQFSLYHDLVVNKLAPQAVVDGDHKSLRKWFVSLEEGTGWAAPGGRFEEGGAVYLRYLRLLEIVENLEGDDRQDEEEISQLLDELELLVNTLTTGIKYLPSSTPIDRYAQHLMSQSLLKASLKLVSSDRGTYEANEDYVVQLRDVLLKLPMSEELVEETQSRLGHEHLKKTILRSIEVLC